MTEKMHLFGLASPILHRAKVKEVKDASTVIIYSSLLLSLLSPIRPCATRNSAILLRICARVGERGKEAPIDAPAAAHLTRIYSPRIDAPAAAHLGDFARYADHCGAGRATLAQVRTSPAGPATATAAPPVRPRSAILPSLLPGRGSFPANGDADRGGNGLRRSFCLLRVARAACGRRRDEFCPAMPGA